MAERLGRAPSTICREINRNGGIRHYRATAAEAKVLGSRAESNPVSWLIQARGVLKRELLSHLRSRRMMRRGKTSTTEGQPRGQIIDAISIRERPADVEDRAVPGHWEGDLLSGAKNTHIATLVERHSRFVMLVKLAGKDTEHVVSALIREVKTLPEGVMQL